MSRITEEVEVAVPVRTAYDQWTQFESFPQFMEGVERVIQLDDRTLEWTATIAGKTKRWRAEIVDQRPDEIVSWRSTDGARNDGSVRFEPVSAGRTRLALQLDIEPEGPVETAGDALGVVDRRVKGDLERFRDFIEGRGRPTGAWRGTVEGGRVAEDDDGAASRGETRESIGVGTAAAGRAPGSGTTATTGSGSSAGTSGSVTGRSGRGTDSGSPA